MNSRALLGALRFDQAEPGALSNLSTAEWRKLLDFADREHITLALGLRFGAALPEWVQSRIGDNLAANAERFARTTRVYADIAAALDSAGIDFAVLKGFSHWPGYSLDPRHRPQYDLDLLFQPNQLQRARDALQGLGYETLTGLGELPVDHLPPMIRRTGWRWKGDYFDVDIPLSVELHFRLWDTGTERIVIPGLDSFWDRRTRRSLNHFCCPALDPIDTLAYASLHLLRHVLRGDFRLYHAYELAHFLERSAGDDAFWNLWQLSHPAALRSIQSIGLRLAAHWFHCRVPEALREEFEREPDAVQRWFSLFAMAPVDAKTRPNKNELWLHLALLNSSRDRWPVLSRRLLPVQGHRTAYAAHVPQSETTWQLQLERRIYHLRFTFARVLHHLRSTAPVLNDGLRWWWSGRELDPQFLRFLAAASFFNFGIAVFFLLFNVFLLQRGFHEDFLGVLASAMSVGSVAGTLPAALILHRFGLRKVFMLTFAGVPVACAIRVLAVPPAVLIGASFFGGCLFSFYAVALSPAVAQLTTKDSRAFGFSLVFSVGIGITVAAVFIGGKLPGFLSGGMAPALMIACVIAALGVFPASRLRFGLPPTPERRVYPRSDFFKRILAALLIWNLATGAFNPFFNVYFAQRLGMPISQIGVVFSVAQIVQVFAVLLAPIVLRRLGAISGVMSMQVCTAAALAALALGPGGWLAGAVYAAYMGFQYMSEPGIYTLLMESVAPEERSGASALNFLVVFGGQAVAAAAAGFGVRRFGYSAVAMAAALTAVLAGVAFLRLRRRSAEIAPE